jgi:hypothetical protein
MPIAEADQFSQMFGQVGQIIIVFAILIVVVGIPLYWLRLKLERGLIHVIRSARSRREKQNFAAKAVESDTSPHCPVCNALMVKRFARRGAGAGSTFWGCSNYPTCRGTRAI